MAANQKPTDASERPITFLLKWATILTAVLFIIVTCGWLDTIKVRTRFSSSLFRSE